MTIQLAPDSSLLDKDFIFGVATAAFQIEGGADHRLPCIWDRFCAQDGVIEDGTDGLVACDHYHRWADDLALVQSLNVDAYRLSLSWPRLIKEDGSINGEGLAYYKDILTDMKRRGLKAFVTFYHWDLPLHLEDQGGWLNRETAYKFRDYVAVISQELKGLVTSYATLNEPFCSAFLGYELGIHAPGIQGAATGRQAAHHLLLAHGLALEVLNQTSPETSNGIVLNMSPCYPLSDSAEDIKAAKNADDYKFQWFARPLLEGAYPDLLADLPESVRPQIMDGDMALISQKLDYLGLNYYTRDVYRAPQAADSAKSSDSAKKWSDENIYQQVMQEEYPLTDMGWEVYPQGLTDLLVGLNDRYTMPPIYITENGAAMAGDTVINGRVADPTRTDYLANHIQAVDTAMRQGVAIKGYFAWSLMDNFEWSFGYAKRFGIVHVDYESQQRTVKDSGKAYANFLASRPHIKDVTHIKIA